LQYLHNSYSSSCKVVVKIVRSKNQIRLLYNCFQLFPIPSFIQILRRCSNYHMCTDGHNDYVPTER
jgi:hypothetical protein